MDLLIQSVTPISNTINIALDTPISITFNQPVDPLTIQYGISLYTLTEGLWSGPDLSVLDTQYSDVLNTGGEYTYFPFSYTVESNTIKLTPDVSLLPDRTYYLQVLPGNNPTRYLSKSTVSEVTYSANVSGQVNILSPYTGDTNSEIVLVFTSSSGFDLVKDSVYVDSYTFASGSVQLEDISISLSGQFSNGDTASFEVYKAEGTTVVYKSKFTTSKYTVSTPTSKVIQTLEDVTYPNIVTASIPANNTINNIKCNPITVRMSQNLSTTQDLTKYITISRYDIDTGITSNIPYYSTINNDTIKLYLVNSTQGE